MVNLFPVTPLITVVTVAYNSIGTLEKCSVQNGGKQCFFELVDINRMRFKQVGEEKGYRSLRPLWVTDEMYKEIAKSYACGRGFDEATACRRVLHYKNQFMRRRK
ncbi:hypothetical protein Barb6_01391 [Bacteroidales bacterium Barb6]|nr:hypothetical protein Barb6_01391 [Bacteroidales bacterium Barb6]